jgi:hypothetical protein
VSTTYEQHLAAGTERELARIEAQHDHDLDIEVDDLWDAEPYDPFGADEAPEPDYFGDAA